MGKMDVRRYDMYGVVPSYKLPAYTSWCGLIATVLTTSLFIVYFTITLKDYITEPSDLILQGKVPVNNVSYPAPSEMSISLQYNDTNGQGHYLDASNKDRLFRMSAKHITIRNQDSVDRDTVSLALKDCGKRAVCIDQEAAEGLMLTADYNSEVYQYIEVKILGCLDVPNILPSECAGQDERDDAIEAGVKVVSYMNVQEFNWNLYPKDEAIQTHEKSQRFFLFSRIGFKNEVYLQARSIDHELKHGGSPPFTEKNTKILSFDRIELRQKPKRHGDGDGYMTFYLRLSNHLSQEETAYWTPSLLDLFGMWGAFFSFLTSLSFGLTARAYNQSRSHKSFKALGGGDIRLYNRKNFDSIGRMAIADEEHRIPTTPIGELRLISENEQRKKQRASQTLHNAISKWSKLKSESSRTSSSQTTCDVGIEMSSNRHHDESSSMLYCDVEMDC